MTQPLLDRSILLNAIPGNHLILLPDEPTFTIVEVTDAYLAATYTQRQDILGKGVFEVFPDNPDNGQAVGAHNLSVSLHQVVHTKTLQRMADQRYDVFNAQSGRFEYKVWQPVNRPVLDGAGNIQYIIHTVEDITTQRQLVEVAEANGYLQTVINEFKEPMQVLQPVFENGEIIDFLFKLTNQAYAAYANSTPDQLQGKRVGDVFPGYFETESFVNPVQTYKTGQPLTFEIHYNKDGLDLYNLMSTVKYNDEVFIHFTDFTHLRQLQLQLESKIGELSRSNDSLRQFAYIASHDLQEPLRKIQSFGDLLMSQYADTLGDGVHHLVRMQTAAGRMSTLIKDLLTYSRITTQPEATAPVSLNEVLVDVLTDLDLVIEETGAQVHVGPLPTVQGDASQLGQLFQNLLSNAIKFRQPATLPIIRVSAQRVTADALPATRRPTRTTAVYHRIDVADNGIGFDNTYVDRIFQVFQRLHGKEQYTGTGIGLAICEKVAANHGGAITACSQVAGGATFSIYLPAE